MIFCTAHTPIHYVYMAWATRLIWHCINSVVIVSPVRSTYGGYYGLVVVTPPRPPHPQTLHRSHDNLKKSLLDCFHILYVHGPSRIIYGPPRPPRIAQNAHFYLPRRRRPGTGDIATPPSVCPSVCPSVRPSVRHV